MLRFPFELRPLAEVPPWGSERPNLHWFGLTSGWYWIDVDGRELLRYTETAVRRWELERPYPRYYVARFWEDLIVLSRAQHEPVPDDLVPFVDGTFPRHAFPEDDEVSAEVDAAFDLQSDYSLYLGPLTGAPMLRCWRHTAGGRDTVTLSQQILPREQDTFAGPERLDFAMPAAEFFAAVEDLDRRLIAAMEERVVALERSGPPPGVDLDVAHLRLEHARRSGWLAKASPLHVDWAAVRTGVAEISSWPLWQSDDD